MFQDDDDEHLDASESVILDNDLDEFPKAVKRKVEEDKNTKSAPPKKVILNRHTSIELTKANPDGKEKHSENEKSEEQGDKKIIKLSSLSAKEVSQYVRFHEFTFISKVAVNDSTDFAKRVLYLCKKIVF